MKCVYYLNIVCFLVCPGVNDTYDFRIFFINFDALLIFMNMQMSYNYNIHIKTPLALTETLPVHLCKVYIHLSLKLFKILRFFVFPKFWVSNWRLLWKRNLYYFWCLLSPQNNIIRSRAVLSCFLARICTFNTFCLCPRVNYNHGFRSFLQFLMFSLIFMNMQISWYN